MIVILYIAVLAFNLGLINLDPLLQISSPLGVIKGRDLLEGLLLVLSFPAYFQQRKKLSTPLFQWLEGFWIVFIIVLAVQSYRSPASNMTERVNALRFIYNFLMFFPSVAILKSKARVREMAIVGVVFAVLGTLLTIAQSLNGLSALFDSSFYNIGSWNGQRNTVNDLTRVNLPISSWLAYVLLFVLIISFIKFKTWYIPLGGFILIAIFINFARSLWLGLFIGFIVALLMLAFGGQLNGIKILRLLVLPIVLIIGLIIAPYIGLTGLASAVTDRISQGIDIFTSTSGTWQTRVYVMNSALNLWLREPLLGVGTSYTRVFDTFIDLGYPLVLLSIGLIGLFLDGCLALICLIVGFNIFKKGILEKSVAQMAVALSLCGEIVLIVIYQQWLDPYSFSILGLVSALTVVIPLIESESSQKRIEVKEAPKSFTSYQDIKPRGVYAQPQVRSASRSVNIIPPSEAAIKALWAPQNLTTLNASSVMMGFVGGVETTAFPQTLSGRNLINDKAKKSQKKPKLKAIVNRTFRSNLFMQNWLLLAFSSLGTQGLGMFATIRIARVMAPQGYGQYNLFQTVASIATVIMALGFRSVLIRQIARQPQQAGKLYFMAVWSRLVAFGLAGVGIFIYSSLSGGEFGLNFGMTALVLILSLSAWDIFESIAFGRQYMTFSAAINISGAIVWVSTCWLVPSTWITPINVSVAFTCLQLIEAIIYWILAKKAGYFNSDQNTSDQSRLSWRSLMGQSLPYYWLALLTASSNYLPILFLNANSGSAEVGIYNVGNKLLTPLTLILMTALSALFPGLARLSVQDVSKFNKTIRSAVFGLTIMGTVVALLVSLLRHEIVLLLFGPSYLKAADAMAFQCWYCVLLALLSLIGTTLGALDKQKLLALLSTCYAIVALPILWWGSQHGSTGLGIAIMAAAIINMSYHWIVFQKNLPEKLSISISIQILIILTVGVLVSFAVPQSLPFIWRGLLALLLLAGSALGLLLQLKQKNNLTSLALNR